MSNNTPKEGNMTNIDPALYNGAYKACMFSYPAISSGSCATTLSKTRAVHLLERYISDYVSQKKSSRYYEVVETLGALQTLGPYLKAIAAEMSLDFMHKNVVETYVFGKWPQNLNTDKVFDNLLGELAKTGVNKTLLKFMAQKAPKPFLPFHGYQTLLKGLDDTNEKKIAGATKCMVREGIVLDTNRKNKATVLTRCLRFDQENGGYVFENCKNEASYKTNFLDYIVMTQNMRVAIHQGWVMDIILDQDKEIFDTLSERNTEVVKLFETYGL